MSEECLLSSWCKFLGHRGTRQRQLQEGCVFKTCFVSLSNRLSEQEVSCGISGQATFWYICISVQRVEREREHKGKIKKERECVFVVVKAWACHWMYWAENRIRRAAHSPDKINSFVEHKKKPNKQKKRAENLLRPQDLTAHYLAFSWKFAVDSLFYPTFSWLFHFCTEGQACEESEEDQSAGGQNRECGRKKAEQRVIEVLLNPPVTCRVF